jgi:hypothetical protein
MSKQQRQEQREHATPESSPFDSGVLPKGLAADADRPPPWDVVLAYLSRGEHRYWVEGWAARTPAFRDVLEALRNDHEERTASRRRSSASPKRR